MMFTADTAHKALTYRLHHRRQTADICRQWGCVTPLYPLFADAPAKMWAAVRKNGVFCTVLALAVYLINENENIRW